MNTTTLAISISGIALLVSVVSVAATIYRTSPSVLLYQEQMAVMRIVASRTMVLWEQLQIIVRMFDIFGGLLRRTKVMVLTVAVAIGGCSTTSQLEKIYEANAPTDEANAPTDEANAPTDQTELTKEIQKMLNEKGFDPGPIDGISGPKTLSALTAYQKKYGLPSTNGINAKAYGQLSISDITRELERKKSERKDEQAKRVAAREAAKRKEFSRNHSSVNFQVSCPDLSIPKIYEKKFQNIIPVYAMAVLNNSKKRYSVEYDLVYEIGTDAVKTMNVFGAVVPGRQGYARTLTKAKNFSVRPGALTEFLLIKKNQGSGSQITEIKAVDVFKCTSP